MSRVAVSHFSHMVTSALLVTFVLHTPPRFIPGFYIIQEFTAFPFHPPASTRILNILQSICQVTVEAENPLFFGLLYSVTKRILTIEDRSLTTESFDAFMAGISLSRTIFGTFQYRVFSFVCCSFTVNLAFVRRLEPSKSLS
jgi:hypothetical protein